MKIGNTLRCCLACIFPCGVLDIIRIVDRHGHVQEVTGRVTAAQVLKDHPNHVLTNPASSHPRILPESQLKRGSIYFLVPAPRHTRNQRNSSSKDPLLPNIRSSRRRQRVWRPQLGRITEEES